MEQPKDYADGQYIVELMPKVAAWAIGVLQVLTVAMGGYGLAKVILISEQVSMMNGRYESEIKSLADRANRSDSRQDRFDERLGRVEADSRR